jgi:hypothetical protein
MVPRFGRPTLARLLMACFVVVLLLAFAVTPVLAQGLRGLYYASTPSSSPDRLKLFSPGNLVLTRIDGPVDFNWGNDAPDPAVPADGFGVRWVGQVVAPASENFTFYTATDDGARLWLSENPIDPENPGTPIINQWVDQGTTQVASKPVPLVKGKKYYIMFEYYENGGGAVARLLWESPSTPQDVIPADALIPGEMPYNPVTLSGTVTNPQGAAAGATVAISGAASRRVTTDDQGKFSMTLLPPGSYKVVAYQAGAYAPEISEITLGPGESKTLDIKLTKPVILTEYPLQYDRDWVNSVDNPTDFTVVTTDPAYDKASLPAGGSKVKVGNVTFTFPSTADGANNVVAMALNTFLVSKANYTGIHILASSGGSSGGGTYNGQAILTYADGTTENIPVSVANRTAAPTANETEVIMATLLDNTGSAVGEGRINYQFIPVDPSKQLVSIGFTTQLSGSTVATPMMWGMVLESVQPLEPLATVSGTVKVAGAPVANAVVRIGPLTATTSTKGTYSFVVPAGTYTLGGLLPGKYAPTLKEITVGAGEKQTVDLELAAAAVQVQYPLNYSHDWISGADAPGDYTFGDTAFIAEQLPITNRKATHGTIEFLMGDVSEGGQNMIFVNGQFLPTPEANYSGFYILESCVSGFYTRQWTLTFTDGTTETVDVQFSDWCGGASKIEEEWKRTVNRHNPSGETGPNCAIFFEPRFISNFTKKLKSITLNPDPSGYPTNSGGLFALTLEAAAPPVMGTLTGKVQGPNGPVAGALVVVGYDPAIHAQGSGWVVGTTDNSGNFSGSAPTGTYPVSIVARGSGLKPMTKTVTIEANKTTDMGTINMESYGSQVVCWLRSESVGQGLRHIDPKVVPDAQTQAFVTTPVTVGGREGRSGTNFAFDVDDNFLFRGKPTSQVWIRIQYYDEGTDTIYIDYTNADLSRGAGKYEVAQDIVDRTDTKTWKTADVALDDAGFYGTQELAGDFRIRSASNLTLGYVVVSTKSQITEPGEPPAIPKVVYGDLNGDGKVGIPDVTIALRIAVGVQTGTPDQIKAGDLNGNGKVEIAEVTKILRYAVGLITTLP